MKVSRMIATGTAVASLGACATSTTSPVPSRTASLAPVSTALTVALQRTWLSYTRTFISADGRVVDRSNGNRTTSEGQSYAMLRAVWMDDRVTFDSVWNWTQQHLWQAAEQRVGWLWNDQLQDGNSAADADSDIALALLFAAQRWSDSSYPAAAMQMLDSIWSNDVATVDGTPYLVAGNWAPNGDPAGAVLDPSYFAPYAYRVFAQADSAHPWNALLASSYRALVGCSTTDLGDGTPVGLPPNWCVLDRSTGRFLPFSSMSGGTQYGYDAFRVMWRVALDELWYGAPQASEYLQSQGFLRSQWQQQGQLAPVYGHDGSVQAGYDDPTVYGGDIGAFLGDPAGMQAIVARKLMPSLQEQNGMVFFGQPDNYYEQNWVWFGLALAAGRLTNLAHS